MTTHDDPFAPGRDLSLLRLLVAWRTSPHHVEVRQVHLARGLQAELTSAARSALTDLTQRSAVPYTAETTLLPTEYATAGSTHLDPDSTVLSALAPLRYPLATGTDLEREFQFFAYLAGGRGNEVIFIAKFNPRRGLRRKKIARWIDDQLTELDEPVLAFDPGGVDLIWSPPDRMAIVSLPVFEFLLRDAPEILAKIPLKVGALSAVMPLAAGSAEALAEAAISNSRIRRRLFMILERGHLTGIPVDAIEAELTAKGYATTDYLRDGKLIITQDNAANALQVLNEDVLWGAFSRTRFAAERKHPT